MVIIDTSAWIDFFRRDGKLEIKPVYMGGPKPVEITSEDAFIFKWMAPMRIQRGECV